LETIKRYRVKDPDLYQALGELEYLRGEFQQAADQFLYHALIVMVEEFPQVVGVQTDPDDTDIDQKLWTQEVMAASVLLFTGLMTGSWPFTIPSGLAFSIYEGQVILMAYGQYEWIILDLQPILEATEQIEELGMAYVEIITPYYWQGPVLSHDNLHAQISVQVDKLIKTHRSYLKYGNYRKHRSLIMSFHKEKVEW
jgi:hypothetical protein